MYQNVPNHQPAIISKQPTTVPNVLALNSILSSMQSTLNPTSGSHCVSCAKRVLNCATYNYLPFLLVLPLSIFMGLCKKNVKIRYPNWWIIDFSLAAIAICLKYPGRLLVTLPKLTISAASSEAQARCPSCWSSGDAGAGSGGSSPGASNGMWKHLEWQLQRSPIDRKNKRSKGLKLWICSSFCFHGSLPLPFFANTGHKLRRSFRPFTIGNRTEISITVPPSWCDWRETKGFFRVFSISDVATYGTRTSAPSPPQIVSKTNLSLCPTLAVHTQIWYCKFYPMIVPLNHHL